MKKVLNIILIIMIMIPFFTVPVTRVQAETLRDLKNKLEKTKEELKHQQEQEKLNQAEMDRINANIANINANITQIGEDVIRLNQEIVDAQEEIKEKDAQIKEVINFLQVSSGEEEYMEYIFGAKDFTDFIYRMSITEQMTDYNNRLIDEANILIENNNKKKEELAEKEKELQKQQEELAVQLKKVKADLSKIYDIFVDLEESIKVQESVIKMYEQDYKCKLDDDINTCARNALPPDTVFWRPLKSAYISSEFGPRSFWLNGVWTSDYHTGMDLAIGVGTPIYATAAGTVAAITPQYYCGGNMVFIHHKVNGQTYTSLYMHMYTINVKVGDVVNRDTVIGTVGGASNYTPWDQCSTGAHLHFTLMYGLVGKDYYAWSDVFYASLINPRLRVNFPGYGSSFWDRTSKY